MASILDQYEDSQNIRQHSRVSAANIGITHSGTNLTLHNLGNCNANIMIWGRCKYLLFRSQVL